MKLNTTSRLLGFLLLGACAGDGSVTSGRLIGTVLDSAGQPLGGAHVAAGGLSATTDDTGHFTLDSVPGLAVVRFDANGFGDAVRRVTIDPDAPSYVEVRLQNAGTPHDVDLPGVGQMVTVLDGGAQVDFAGGSLCTPDNVPVVGRISVTLTNYPATDERVAPSDLETTDGQQLVTAGMVNVTASRGGEALSVCADGSKLTMLQPIFGGLNPLDYRHYLLDDEGLWEDVGAGTFDPSSGRWSAGLRRLGPHNVDVPAQEGTIQGRVLNAFYGGVAGARLDAYIHLTEPAYRVTWTNGGGGYALNPTTPHGADLVTVTLSGVSYPGDQVLESPSVVQTWVSTGSTQTIDFQLCLVERARCDGGGRCCPGLSCQDSLCLP